jgi:hypothetical protein
MKVGGRVQRGVRRALLLLREATTAELLRWCYREPGRTRRERKNRARMVWFVAMKMADRAQGVGGAVNPGAAVRGAVVRGIPTPTDLGASSSSYYRSQHKQGTAHRKPRRSQ